MKFETLDGRFFSLLVEEYEFPDEELSPTEDNPAEDFETDRFLIVSHSFRNSDGEWRIELNQRLMAGKMNEDEKKIG